jgi:hypothetical protein
MLSAIPQRVMIIIGWSLTRLAILASLTSNED